MRTCYTHVYAYLLNMMRTLFNVCRPTYYTKQFMCKTYEHVKYVYVLVLPVCVIQKCILPISVVQTCITCK